VRQGDGRGATAPGCTVTAALTILADDLSGAADAALQAVCRGLRTLVRLGPLVADGVAADVIAWDLDTRESDAGTAFQRTLAAATSLPAGGELYLKLDSSLRGEIGSAVDAGLAATGARVALVAPAFPALGRTTVGAIQHIAPLDGSRPAVTRDLLALLQEQSRNAVAHLSLDQVRCGEAAGALASLPGTGPWVVACDAEHESDLEHLVVGFAAQPGRVVWAGSAGLVAALVGSREPDGVPALRSLAATGPVLVVAGSTAPDTLAQVRTLFASGSLAEVAAGAAALAGAPADASAEAARAAGELGALLAAGRDCVLHAPGDAAGAAQAAERIATGLGQVVALAAGKGAPGALILTGGQTARSVCGALGIEAIELLGELEAGIPIGRVLGTGLPIVTKAGAFGAAGSLLRARDALTTAARPG